MYLLPLYVSWPHGSSALPGWLLGWCLLVCVCTAGVGGFAADGMAAKVWTCTLLSCSFTYIRGAPVVSYVYMPPRSTAMVVFEKYHVTYYALDMRIYNTVLIYLNIYNLSNITCHHHNFCVRNRSRLHIMRVWHPRQRAGIAIACPVDSLAHRATASCTPIVHPPSWQPGPLGNRQLHDHSAPPAASLAHRATASCTPMCNHPAASWTLAQPLGSPSVHTPAPPSPVPSNLWLISPLSPHVTDEDETRMPVFKCLPD